VVWLEKEKDYPIRMVVFSLLENKGNGDEKRRGWGEYVVESGKKNSTTVGPRKPAQNRGRGRKHKP